MTKQVVELPITGWFSEPERKFSHEVPALPELSLDAPIRDAFRTEPTRPLKSWAVEALDRVANLDGQLWAGSQDVGHWLEAGGYVEPVEFKKEAPYRGDVIYRITEKGEQFLRQHEAPIHWS